MLYFKKKRILKVLARNLFAGVISVLFVMIFILKIFGFQYVDVAIVLNAVLMVCIVAQSDQAVSRRYVRILTATAAVFFTGAIMKIGIFGNYGHSNIGDEAILRGLLTLFKGQDISIFSDNISIVTRCSWKATSIRTIPAST